MLVVAAGVLVAAVAAVGVAADIVAAAIAGVACCILYPRTLSELHVRDTFRSQPKQWQALALRIV